MVALRPADTGVAVAEVCRKMGLSEATYYNWKKEYGGLGVPEWRRLNQLEEEKQQLGVVPTRIQVDNGSEFIRKALARWADDQHVTRDFSRPGNPTDNPYSESLNGSFLRRVLN